MKLSKFPECFIIIDFFTKPAQFEKKKLNNTKTVFQESKELKSSFEP